MSNSDRFLDAFNKIESHLRRIAKANKETTFHTVVETAGKWQTPVRHFTNDLKEFADLRNAITHERTDGHVIAEPNDRAVAEIARIASLLLDPPKVVPRFQKEVVVLSAGDPVAKAVRFMFSYSFSQIPVYDNQRFRGLLTGDTVARWLGASVAEDVFSLHETRIDSVLAHAEEESTYCFLAKNATLTEALDRFRDFERRGNELEAILITDSGKPTESLLGMITLWDLPEIYDELEGSRD